MATETSSAELSSGNPAEGTGRLQALLVLQTIARYALGIGIFLYGLQKITNLQIQLSAWDYARPLIRSQGTALTWAFLGYQPWFQCLGGVMEAVPGLMLLSRRMWRLGALLLFPVLLNVALINWAMDLWLDTRILSLCLLAVNIFLISRSLPAYVAFLRALTPRPQPIRSRRWRIAANIAVPLAPVAAVAMYLYLMNQPNVKAVRGEADFIGVRQINGAGTWSVEEAAIGGQEVAGGSERKLYFDFSNKCVFTAPGQELTGTFKSEQAGHTFEISGVALDGDPATIGGTYQVKDNRLVLAGEQNHKPVTMTLKRWKWGPMLPFGS